MISSDREHAFEITSLDLLKYRKTLSESEDIHHEVNPL